ncbi:hypothetical protein F2P81_013773 [Scophthalmus maximus]|uniref:Uncharacterized protein n=1 Tax=Scophthalmus maximus TaxID=52904 RepID=A0A6A4SKI2_SCOMX|nr:hypothetical protein F2P81_013773 [Scophthalmus maximus]
MDAGINPEGQIIQECASTFDHSRRFWQEQEILEHHKSDLRRAENLRLNKALDRETQTTHTWKDMDTLLQEKHASEAREQELWEDLSILSELTSGAEKREQKALLEKESLQEHVDEIFEEAMSNLTAWEEERMNLLRQLSQAKEKARAAMQVNEALQSKIQALESSLQGEKELSLINEAIIRTQVRERKLREELEEEDRVHRSEERSVTEAVKALREQIVALEQKLMNQVGGQE